jgi:hypothetical protein
MPGAPATGEGLSDQIVFYRFDSDTQKSSFAGIKKPRQSGDGRKAIGRGSEWSSPVGDPGAKNVNVGCIAPRKYPLLTPTKLEAAGQKM